MLPGHRFAPGGRANAPARRHADAPEAYGLEEPVSTNELLDASCSAGFHFHPPRKVLSFGSMATVSNHSA
jgi:hypothetical protein